MVEFNGKDSFDKICLLSVFYLSVLCSLSSHDYETSNGLRNQKIYLERG